MRKQILLAALLSLFSVATTQAQVTVTDVSNSQCAYRTRGASVMGHPTLKLTRFDNGLYGELKNFEVNCAHGKINVFCEEEGENLVIIVYEELGELIAACLCPINIYFTLNNVMQDEYQLRLGGQGLGAISFKDHSVVEIDLITLEQAHEEGFEYPVFAQDFYTYEITNYISPGQDLSPRFDIYDEDDQQLHCAYRYYSLPCDYSYLDVQAELDKDELLVVNILTDGIPGQGCKRVAHLKFSIANTPKDSYHLQLNHTILTKDEDGKETPHTVCLYDGVFTLPMYDIVSIPITDNTDYNALVSGISNPSTIIGSFSSLFDLTGRPLSTPPSRGMYIQNGKKVIK